MSDLQRVVLRSIGLLGVILVSGCSSGEAGGKVSGTVTENGTAVAAAKITFMGAPQGDKPGPQFMAKTDDQGKYSLIVADPTKGVPSGPYKVTVVKYAPKKGAKMPDENDIDQMVVAGLVTITTPRIYADPEKTPLKADVVTGSNTVDLQLKK